MLGSRKIVAFVPTQDSPKARLFYEGILGLRFVSDDPFALVFDANGISVRVTKIAVFAPAPFTILGWEVSNLEEVVAGLAQNGVRFERYGMKEQDERGIWLSPSGAKVAWFKDPDGNVLSLTQFS
jgi:catechol 2,3-dioxygenase-like lactoylglutathione lyase family enzyme